jgi:hypothetical protein
MPPPRQSIQIKVVAQRQNCLEYTNKSQVTDYSNRLYVVNGKDVETEGDLGRYHESKKKLRTALYVLLPNNNVIKVLDYGEHDSRLVLTFPNPLLQNALFYVGVSVLYVIGSSLVIHLIHMYHESYSWVPKWTRDQLLVTGVSIAHLHFAHLVSLTDVS